MNSICLSVKVLIFVFITTRYVDSAEVEATQNDFSVYADSYKLEAIPPVSPLNFSEGIPSDRAELATFAMRSMIDTITKMNSGEVLIERIVTDNESPPRTVSYHLWFEYDKKLFRQDKFNNARLVQWSRNAENSLLHIDMTSNPGADVVTIHPLDANTGIDDAFPVDIRALPFQLPSGLFAFMGAKSTLDSTRFQSPVIDVLDTRNENRLTIVFNSTNPNSNLGQLRSSYVLDPSNDFCTLEFSIWQTSEDGQMLKELCKTTTEWIKIEEYNVPAKCTLDDNFSKVEFTFDWKMVNQPPKKEIYQLEGLGLKASTNLADKRVDPPLALGTWGEYLTSAATPPLISVLESNPQSSRGWLIILNIVVISLIVCGLWFRSLYRPS